MQNSQTRKSVEIKIATVVAVAIILTKATIPELELALKDITAGTPDFFEDEFAILDIEAVSQEKFDWPKVCALFKSFGLNVVAVRNARPEDQANIRGYGLIIDAVSKLRNEEAPLPTAKEEPKPSAPTLAPQLQISNVAAMVIDTPVRAGQRIYARGADLIITAAVNNGAEVIADGSIHIYAPLRGRALAGASGNTNARIYALTMEPELVSIAGIYRTFENGFPELPAQHPVQIKLIGDSIEVSSMKSAA
ncbi:septum site-determining protein MinC [Undibacterium sp. Ren11W]|uniref:septum site-determining protein MinC n=1 Tax=Undibacterium sp. Ren11W TaxID=3413045 RepID=UPI003BF18672